MTNSENDQKPILSIGLLASDRKDTIEKCLASLTPIRKALPSELIITDTGCSPQVRQILEKYANVLTEFSWTGDFSEARNENLRYARGDWYLFLDDDEWFVETESLIRFFRTDNCKKCDGAAYIQRNFQEWDGSLYSDYHVCRMIRLDRERHFRGKIHEYFDPEPDMIMMIDAMVEHYGYIFKDEESKKAHYERNHTLLMEMIEKEPENLHWRTHLAQEYILMRDAEKLYQLGEDGLKLVEGKEDPESVGNRGTFYLCRIAACEITHEDEKEWKCCTEAMEDDRNLTLCKAFSEWWRAHSLFSLGRYEEAQDDIVNYLEQYDRMKKEPVEFARQRMFLLIGQCYDEIKVQEAYGLLIAANLKLGQTEYLGRYLEELHLDQKNAHYYEGLPEAVVEALEKLLEVFTDEKQMELFIKLFWKFKNHPKFWEDFSLILVRLINSDHSGKSVALQFCAQAGADQQTQALIKWYNAQEELNDYWHIQRYPELKDLFKTYSENALIYFQCALGNAFRDRDELPPECLEAMILEEAFAQDADKETFVKLIQQAAAIYPVFANQLKKLLTLYLQEPQRKEREAKKELRKMKEELMKQVEELAQKGLYQEGYMITQQLRQLFPDDLSVMSLSLRMQIGIAESSLND